MRSPSSSPGLYLFSKPEYGDRLRQVMDVFVRHGFEDLLADMGLRKYLPTGVRVAENIVERRRPEQLRQALEDLGVTFVKLGQHLAAHPNLIPFSTIKEIAWIEDRAHPVEAARWREQVELELNQPFDDVFESFDNEPVGCTSLVQTHRARLRHRPSVEGIEEVTVKALKPRAEEKVEIDLAILEELANSLKQSPLAPDFPSSLLLAGLRAELRAELDLSREVKNCGRLRDFMLGFERLRVPRPIPELSGRRVFVLEHVPGAAFSDSLGKERRRRLADDLWRAYLKLVLVDGALHDRIRPQSIRLDDQDRVVIPEPGTMTYLSRETCLRLMVLFLALLDRDGERAALAAIELGCPGPKFREREFAKEAGTVVARGSGSTIGELALELAAAAMRHDARIPPEMMMVGRALSDLETTCLRLEPEMEQAAAMREVVSSFLGEQVSRELSTPRILATSVGLLSFLDEVPGNLRRIIGRASSNELQLGIVLEPHEEIRTTAHKVANRVTVGVISAALIVGTALMLHVDSTWKVGGYPPFALLAFLLAVGFGLYVVVRSLLENK